MYENGEIVMYVELLKALYRTIWAAHLFWEKLSKKQLEWGLSLNPYDSCIAIKMVNGSQLTVVWHVDDLKLSHKEQCMVNLLIDQLNEEFGKEGMGDSQVQKGQGTWISIISMLQTKLKRNSYGLNTVPPKKCLLTSSCNPWVT